MKKLLLILLCLPLLFTTCKKEDEEPTNTGNNTGNNTSLIVGEWKLNYMETDMNPLNINEIWNDNNGTINLDIDGILYHLEFFSNKELKAYEMGDDGVVNVNGTWLVSGDDLYITNFYSDFIYSSLDDLERPITIDLLNSNNLHLIEIFTNAQENYYGENRYFFERL